MVDIQKAVIAKLKSNGISFEILVDCDNALKFRSGQDVLLDDLLASQEVFTDAKKGLLASQTEMQNVFGSCDINIVSEKIIKKGEIQVTSEYKAKQREQKLKQIIDIIHKNCIDPKTKLPHPLNRIELAFNEAKIKIEESKPVQEQVENIIKQLRPIIPIRFEKKNIAIMIPAQYGAKSYSTVRRFGAIKKEEWLNNGSWSCIIEIPAGLQPELFEKLNKLTQGNVQIKILETQEGEN